MYELERNNVNDDNSNDELELYVYRKPTHTGLYNKWDSLVPGKYTINLMQICNNH